MIGRDTCPDSPGLDPISNVRLLLLSVFPLLRCLSLTWLWAGSVHGLRARLNVDDVHDRTRSVALPPSPLVSICFSLARSLTLSLFLSLHECSVPDDCAVGTVQGALGRVSTLARSEVATFARFNGHINMLALLVGLVAQKGFWCRREGMGIRDLYKKGGLETEDKCRS